MKAGALRYRIVIQEKSIARDAAGGEVATWATTATVWAELEPWHLRERMRLRRDAGQQGVSLRVRWPCPVTLESRVVFEGVAHRVVDLDLSRRHRGELSFVAEENPDG